MNINNSKLAEYKNRVKRRKKRYEERIKEYEYKKDKLSIHGYWSLGYFIGINSELDNLLGDIEELFEEVKGSNSSMTINITELERYKNRIERKLKRSEQKTKEYEDKKDGLSIHGYWGLGYYAGLSSEFDNILGYIEELLEKCKLIDSEK